jgi:histone H3/H4
MATTGTGTTTQETFLRGVLRVSTAILVKGVGYDSARPSALEALTDVLGRYIEEVGARAHEYAEASTRTEANVLDAAAALADMGTRLDALDEFHERADEIPFPQPTRERDAEQRQRRMRALRDQAAAVAPDADGQVVRPPCVPPWLPPFPKLHTYAKTPAEAPRYETAHALRRQRAKVQRSVEETLVAVWKEMGAEHTGRDYVSAVSVTSATTADTAGAPSPLSVAPIPLPPPTAPEQQPGPGHCKPRELSDGEEEREEGGDKGGTKRRSDDLMMMPEGVEDTEKTKKRLKCDQILSLTHQNGMEQDLFEPPPQQVVVPHPQPQRQPQPIPPSSSPTP